MKKKPSPALVKADGIVYKALKYFSYLSGIAVLAIMLLAFADVISSKVFGKAIPSATEWITYLNVVVVLPTLAYIQLDTGHINVELFSGGNRIVKLVIPGAEQCVRSDFQCIAGLQRTEIDRRVLC